MKFDEGRKLRAAPLSAILELEEEVDLVKVDVEGAEWLVLEGAEAIMPRIRRWVIELHEPSRKAELEHRMRQHGYNKNSWLDSAHLASQRSPP